LSCTRGGGGKLQTKARLCRPGKKEKKGGTKNANNKIEEGRSPKRNSHLRRGEKEAVAIFQNLRHKKKKERVEKGEPLEKKKRTRKGDFFGRSNQDTGERRSAGTLHFFPGGGGGEKA